MNKFCLKLPTLVILFILVFSLPAGFAVQRFKPVAPQMQNGAGASVQVPTVTIKKTSAANTPSPAVMIKVSQNQLPLPVTLQAPIMQIQSQQNMDEATVAGATRTLTGHTSTVKSVAWSPDGTKIASGSNDNTIKIWNATDGALIRTIAGGSGWVDSVAWSPDGTKIASGHASQAVKIWNATDGALITNIFDSGAFVNSVAWSPDGTKVVANSGSNAAKTWNAATGALINTLTGHTDKINSVAWSPDGTKIASGSVDNTAKIWDASTGAVIRTLSHGAAVQSVAWSPDSSKVASGANDNATKIWNASTGALIHTLIGHAADVNSVAWSPDSTKIASGSIDNTAKTWNTLTGATIRTLSGHTDSIYSVAWSPDNSKIVTGSADKTIKIWNNAADETTPITAITNVFGLNSYTHPIDDVFADGNYLYSVQWGKTSRTYLSYDGTQFRTLYSTNTVGPTAFYNGALYSAYQNGQNYPVEIKTTKIYSDGRRETLPTCYVDGTTLDITVSSMKIYKGKIYIGLTNPHYEKEGVIYVFNGASWSRFYSTDSRVNLLYAGDSDGLFFAGKGGVSKYDGTSISLVLPGYGPGKMIKYNGNFYLNSGSRIYKWNGISSSASVAYENSAYSAAAFGIYKNELYAGLKNTFDAASEIRKTSGLSFDKVSYYTDEEIVFGANSMAAYEDKLYFGTDETIYALNIFDDMLPIVAFTADPLATKPNYEVKFDASASYDSDGTIRQYEWNFGDGQVTSSGSPYISHKFGSAGAFTVTLRARDNYDVYSTPVTVQITVVANLLPVALLTANQTNARPDKNILFDGSSSYDSDGTIVSYELNFGDGNITIGTGYPGTILHAYSAAGIYPAHLTVTDNDGATSQNMTATMITVTDNVAPVVGLTANVTSGRIPLSVLFTGNSSYDSDGTVASWTLNFGDGAQANGTLISLATAAHTYSAAGLYDSVLTVKDDDGVTASKTVRINVTGNIPPVAEAGADQYVYEMKTVSLNGNASYDPDGSIALYKWDYTNDGFWDYAGTDSNVTYKYPFIGTYAAKLEVTDNDGANATDLVHIYVVENQAPIANAGPDQTVKVNRPVNLNGTGTDSDGTIALYEWDFNNDGYFEWSNATSGYAEYNYTSAGAKTAVLRVTDDSGKTATDAASITVSPNIAPAAEMTANVTSAIVPFTVNFNTSASNDPDGTIVSRAINFGDGNQTVLGGTVISHTYSVPGTYNVTLTVADDDGATATAFISITAISQNQPPVVSITTPTQSIYRLQSVLLNGTCTDADGIINSCEWMKGSTVLGSNPYSFVTNSSTVLGVHEFILVAVDNNSATTNSSVNITVLNVLPIAEAGPDRIAPTNVSIQLNGTGIDSDGYIALYEWDFNGDGTYDWSSATNGSTSRIYALAGNYTAVLRVTDNDGGIAADSTNVVVSDTPLNHIQDSTLDGMYYSDIYTSDTVLGHTSVEAYTSIIKSTVEWSNFSTADVFNSTILNSTIINSTAYNTYLANSYIDPSNTTGSNITISTVINSNVTFSNVTLSYIKNSNVNGSVLYNATIINGRVFGSRIADSTITNSFVNLSTIIRSAIDNSYVFNSTIINSTIVNMTVLNAYIQDGIIYNGTVTYNGVNYTAPPATNVSDIIDQAPASVWLMAISATNQSILLNWSAYPKANFWKYEIHRATGSFAPNATTLIITLLTKSTTAYAAAGLNENTTYYFIMRSFANSNQSSDSNEVWMTTTVGGDTHVNQYPTANAGSGLSTTAGTSVQLNGTGTDSDGTISLYEWDFNGDGVYDWNSTTTGYVNYTYAAAGTYAATFRVIDNAGAISAANTATVSVTAPPGPGPGQSAGASSGFGWTDSGSYAVTFEYNYSQLGISATRKCDANSVRKQTVCELTLKNLLQANRAISIKDVLPAGLAASFTKVESEPMPNAISGNNATMNWDITLAKDGVFTAKQNFSTYIYKQGLKIGAPIITETTGQVPQPNEETAENSTQTETAPAGSAGITGAVLSIFTGNFLGVPYFLSIVLAAVLAFGLAYTLNSGVKNWADRRFGGMNAWLNGEEPVEKAKPKKPKKGRKRKEEEED